MSEDQEFESARVRPPRGQRPITGLGLLIGIIAVLMMRLMLSDSTDEGRRGDFGQTSARTTAELRAADCKYCVASDHAAHFASMLRSDD